MTETGSAAAGASSDFAFSGDMELAMMGLAVRYNAALLKWVSDAIQPGARVLDFGAGTGRYCNQLKAGGIDVSAVELDRRYHASIQCPVATTVDQLGSSFDLVYSINVLEHVEDDAAIVGNLHRALKPGGRALIFVPALPMLFSEMDRRVGHFRRYTRRSLTDVFIHAGFSIASCRYYDLLGFFATLAYKPFGSGSFSPRSLVMYDRAVFPLSRALDRLTRGALLGKNLMLEATRA